MNSESSRALRLSIFTVRVWALALWGALCGTSIHAATTVTLASVADTTLRQQQSNQNRGTDETLRLGWSQGSRALVRFDQAAIAAAIGSGTLVSAHLELFVEETGESWGSGTQNVDVHRLTAAWTERGATWNCAVDSNPSNNSANCSPRWNGGTFAPTPTASVAHAKSTRGLVRFAVTADVASFLTGTPNQGWLLKKANENRSGRIDYVSREGEEGEDDEEGDSTSDVSASSNPEGDDDDEEDDDGPGPRLVLVVETAGGGDTTAPSVAITFPTNGALLAAAQPTITATYADAESGIDLAAVRLTVDGVDRTADAAVAPSGLTWTPVDPIVDGPHTVEVAVRDLAGNPAQASAAFSNDTVVPTLAITSPNSGRNIGATAPNVEITYADLGSGIDLATVRVLLDGTATSGCTVSANAASCPAAGLATGAHRLAAEVRDRAGNPTSAGVGFEFIRDLAAPTIAIESPSDGAIGNAAAVLVVGTVADDSGVEIGVRVNDQPAAVTAGRFSVFVPLAEGANEIAAIATDVAGRNATATIGVALDTEPPTLGLDAPNEGSTTNAAVARVVGAAADTFGLAEVVVAGTPAPLAGGRFAVDVPLLEGANVLEVRARDRAGNATTRQVAVNRFSLPTVEIAEPADLATLAATTAEVRGTVDPPDASVAVNGVIAVVSGGTFVASGVPLIEGGNLLTAVATAGAGRVGTASINVVRDLVAPRLSIDRPRADATVATPTVDVVGLVNDIVAGTVNAEQVTVVVNGRPALVENRSFYATGVPLAPGVNTITAVATDVSGNVGQAAITVRLDTAPAPRIAVVAGDRQSGVIRTQLAAPLTVALTDAAGLPAVGKTVLFKVVGADGKLDGAGRQVSKVTGPDGRASVNWTLSSRAGAGNQIVEAVAAGFLGPAVFTASAAHGPAALIVVDAGDQQEGATGQLLPRPLIAAVTDEGSNRVPGERVRWTVVKGGGTFADGSVGRREIEVVTDSDGRVVVPFRLDDAEGIANNVVEAVIAALPASPSTPIAGFVATGRTGGVAATTITGIVLDNSNQPVPGATLRILGSPLTTTTNAEGLFRLVDVPVGTVKLIVDGSTVARPGSWPDLEFVMSTIPGRDNTLGMPIFLLPLDLGSGVPIDETRGGRITLAEVPGFALDIAPGSVTFPGGSRSGVVSVTAVHGDKVPMVPNFGQQPRLIVTIQPAGARFDPPARLTLPNVEGYAPGQVTEFYSFDHDLGHFVSIGPATVSDDGSVIVSNPGVGIVKAGWHCGGNPSGSGTSHDCPECQKCVNNRCAPDDGASCDDKDMCTFDDKCMGGTCKGTQVMISAINGNCVAAVNQAISLTAAANGGTDKIEWMAPSGTPAMGMGASFSVTYSTEGDFTVTAMCKASSKTKRVSTGPDCASITPMLKEPEKPMAAAANSYGTIFHGTQRVGKYKGCVGGGQWCFRLEEYLEEHGFGVNGNGRTNISSAADPAVTPATCAAIIADFTPPPVGTQSGPPRTAYWSQSITEAHERFHVRDFSTRVTQKVYADLQAFVNQASRCTMCKTATPTATFDGEKDRLWNVHRPNYFDGLSEARAHNVSNPMYASLIAAIKARARAAPAVQNWPAACK